MRRTMGLTVMSALLVAGCGTSQRTGTLAAPTTLPSAVPASLGPATPSPSPSPDGFRDPGQQLCRTDPTDNSEVYSFGDAAPAHLPADFVVTKVDWCASATISHNGNTVATLEQREATGDFSAFVADLRGPDGPPAPNGEVACAAYADLLPELVVTDAAGRVFAPRFPQDYCNHNFGSAAKDFQQLAYRVISQQDLDTVDSAASRASGCSYRFKSLSELHATNMPAPTASGQVLTHGLVAPVTECDYDRGADGIGTLTAGTVLGPAKTAALQKATATLPAAAPCALEAPKFALLQAQKGDVVIELAGCGRVADDSFRVHAGNAAVSAAIALPNDGGHP